MAGFLIQVVSVYLGPEWINTFLFIGLIVILGFRPHGLFGPGDRESRLMAQRVVAGSRSVVGSSPGNAEEPGASSERRMPRVPPEIAAAFQRAPLVWLGNAWVSGVVGLAAVILASGLFGFASYHTFVIESVAIYAIAAYGLDIATGYAGVFSLGAGAAFAVGGYTVAILGTALWHRRRVERPARGRVEWRAWPVMGIPASRLGGIGLALVSVGFLLVIGDLSLNWKSLTGGQPRHRRSGPARRLGVELQSDVRTPTRS